MSLRRTRRGCSSSAARTPADLAAMVDRRAAGLPLEHVLGWAEFCGLRIAVDPGVFVPRRRTEFLVGQARARQPVARPTPSRRRRPVLRLRRGGCRAGRGPGRSSCTPSTSTRRGAVRPPQRRRRRWAGVQRRPLRAAARRRCGAASTSWSPTRPTFPPRRSGCCLPRPACTSRGWRSTVARTGSTSCGGSPPRRRRWLARAGTCWSRPASRQAPQTGRGGCPRRTGPAGRQLRRAERAHRHRNPRTRLTTKLRPARAPIQRASARTRRRRTRHRRSCRARAGGRSARAGGQPSP